MKRLVQPELLDELPPRDPRAARSRRDLRRLNAWMGHHAIMARALGAALNGEPMSHVVELGAGDGHFLLRVACRLNGVGGHVEATLVDQLEVVDPQACRSLERAGWRVAAETSEATHWLRENRGSSRQIILCNLLLHQLSWDQLAELLHLSAQSCHGFIALEPRRARWPLFCSRLLWLIGCGAVTRHDAPVSVAAGFRGKELTALWPDAEGWQLTEQSVGWCSHLFVARQRA